MNRKDLEEALNLLGLPFMSVPPRPTINAAFKRMILKFHPDRNKSEDATRMAQALNDARDRLFQEWDKYDVLFREQEERDRKAREDARRREEEEERMRMEEEELKKWEERLRREQEEFTRREEEERFMRAEKEAEDARMRQEEEERFKKAEKEAEDARLRQEQEEESKKRFREEEEVGVEEENRRKRLSGKRLHRAVSSNPDSLNLLEEMKLFFESKFRATTTRGNYVYAKDIYDLFMTSRGRDIYPIEMNFFRRNCQAALKTVFPDAKYLKHNNLRAYLYIELKSE